MFRTAALLLVAGYVASAAGGGSAFAQPVARPLDRPILLTADRDDDDADGAPDGTQIFLPPVARVDLVPVDARLIGATINALAGADNVRLVVGGRPVPWGRPIAPGTFVQGLSPGVVHAVVTRGGTQMPLEIEVRGISMRDGEGKNVSLAREHASIERTPPTRDVGGGAANYDDPDALRVVTEIEEGATPIAPLSVESVSASGVVLDVLRNVPVSAVPCRAAATQRCAATAPIRFVIDDVDRIHPLVQSRSIRAEVGGAIVVREGIRKLQAIRVLGPRSSPVGAIDRLKATIRPVVMRIVPGGAPSIGGTDAGAVAAFRAELALASSIWGQCGITFGPAASIDVKVMSPPPSHLVSLGDDVGLPASGGEIHLRADGRPLSVTVKKGWGPGQAASELARVVERAGLVAVVSENARIAPGAAPSVDVSVRKRDGTLLGVEAGTPMSTDTSLSVRIGAVDLMDGLHHFSDMDSVSGTLEERTLIKAIEDGDPRTIEVIVVPSFAGGGRIGESFIASDGSSLRNVVLLDRAGVRARRSSLTLAHELGHVILDMPGHPDDYGIDTPTLLMDSDASDSSPFGPRRLTVDECARVIREAGPRARVPLLQEWKIGPLFY